MKIAERIQKQTYAVVLISCFALGKVCSNRARFLMANKNGIKILVVVGEIGGSGLGRRCAVAGNILAEIGDRQLGFARMVFQKIFQFGRAMHAGNL